MMLYSESIDVNKTSALKQCIIFFYWTFIKSLSFIQLSAMDVIMYY